MNYILAILVLVFANLSNAQAAQVQSDIDKQLLKNAERYGVVGQSVLILKNHKPVYRGVQGFANQELNVEVNKDHLFPSYSVAKLFTSVLIMQLVEQGKLELQASVRAYLPHLPAKWHKVTLEHLLSHTSGVPRYFDTVIATHSFLSDKNAVYSSLIEAPEHFEIGSQNRYNNTNFLLLASVLEAKTNKPYKQLVQQRLIAPLKLTNTGFASAKLIKPNMVTSYQGSEGELRKNLDIDWPDYSFAHSALYSTPEDLASFMTALVTGKIVETETLFSLWQPMKLTNGKPGSYAFGFEYSLENGFIRVGHDGGNRVKLRHYFNMENRSDNYTLVYMTNGNAYNVWTDVLADSVMSIIAPKVFNLAQLKEQFISATLSKNKDAMEQVFTTLKAAQLPPDFSSERFLLYRAYSIRYASGIEASIPAFEFLVEKFPESKSAKEHLNKMKQSS